MFSFEVFHLFSQTFENMYFMDWLSLTWQRDCDVCWACVTRGCLCIFRCWVVIINSRYNSLRIIVFRQFQVCAINIVKYECKRVYVYNDAKRFWLTTNNITVHTGHCETLASFPYRSIVIYISVMEPWQSLHGARVAELRHHADSRLCISWKSDYCWNIEIKWIVFSWILCIRSLNWTHVQSLMRI